MISYSEWSKKLGSPDLEGMSKEERRLIDIARNLHKQARRIEFQVHGMYNTRLWEAGAEERARRAEEAYQEKPYFYDLDPAKIKKFMETQENKLR